jgi:hypothetical protein
LDILLCTFAEYLYNTANKIAWLLALCQTFAWVFHKFVGCNRLLEREAESFDFSGGVRNLEALSEEKGRTKSNLAPRAN